MGLLTNPVLFNQNDAWSSLMARHSRTATTYAGLVNDSAQNPTEHAKQFINELIGLDMDYADFLSQVNMIPLSGAPLILDGWELDDVGDIRKHTENTDADHAVTENHESRTLTPQLIDLLVELSYERVGRWLRSSQGEGATLGKGVKLIIKEIKSKARRELQNLWINGNTDSTDAWTAIQDGWIKKGIVAATDANINATTWAATPDIKANLLWLRRRATQVRHGKLLKLKDRAYIMSEYAHDIFVEQLAALTSDSAHSLYFVDPKTGVPRYKGIPIVMPNYWPDDLIVLTSRKNFAGGISDEISRDVPLIEYTRVVKPAKHEFVARFSGDCNIIKPDIFLVAYDDANSDYVTYDAT